MVSRRIRDFKILYDRDDGRSQVIAQRQYVDGAGNLLTPITTRFLLRVVSGSTQIEYPKIRKYRHLENFIKNPSNAKGYSEIMLFLPYRPGDPDLLEQLKEVSKEDRVICFNYRGESLEKIGV
jgi:hypothetical protein